MISNPARDSRQVPALLTLPAACAALTLGVICYLTGVFDPASWAGIHSAAELAESAGLDAFGVGVTAYNLLGPLALAVLIVVASRRHPKGLPVVVAAAITYTAATFYALIEMVFDESSTAVLLLLFLPFYLCCLLAPFALATVLVHRLRSRTPRKSGAEGLPAA